MSFSGDGQPNVYTAKWRGMYLYRINIKRNKKQKKFPIYLETKNVISFFVPCLI